MTVRDLIDYIYEKGGEPTIPSKKGAKFERHCDWWLYEERHLVEKYFGELEGISPALTLVMISWHSHIWGSYALLQS